MKSFSVIWYMFLLVIRLLVRKADATITWTLPSQRGPLSSTDNSVRTTRKELEAGSPVLSLEWDFALSGESLSRVSWQRDSIQIGSKSSSGAVLLFPAFEGQLNISRSDPATLIIYNTTAANGSTFECTVSTDLRNWRDRITVVIYEQTKLIGYSGDQVINENSNLPLFCNTTGKPTVSVNWTRVLDDGSNDDIMFVGNPLIIRNIKRNVSGTYRCAADNGFGNTVTRYMHVNVTYPPQVGDLQRGVLKASYQTVILQCPAEGNPPPKYTWSPCKKGRVCDEPKLNLGEVVSDEVYTCSVSNSLGSDAKNVTLFIAARTINVTLVITSEKCTDGKYNTSSIEDKLIDLMAIIFDASDLDFNGAKLENYSCGSLTVYMALKFSNITKEKDVIERIRTAVINGTTGGFTFDVSSITGTRIPSEGTTTVPTSPTSSPKGIAGWIIPVVAVVSVLILILLVVLAILLKKKGVCSRPFNDGKHPRVQSNEGAQMEPRYSSDDNQYAAAGPNASYHASDQSSAPSPTYEVANRRSKGRRGNGPSPPVEPLPEYAVVNKTKKKKKPPKPGELQYAELGDLTGPGKKTALPRVSGTDTVYSDIRS